MLVMAILACLPMYAAGQYTFSISYTLTGNCGGIQGGVERATIDGWFNYVNQMIASLQMSKQECMMMRSQLQTEALDYSSWGCSAKFTFSPCTGTGGDDVGTGTEIVLGVSNGRSFFTNNPANENANWWNDDLGRQVALDTAYMSLNYSFAITGDKDYDNSRLTGRKDAWSRHSERKQSGGWTLDGDRVFKSLNIDWNTGNSHSSSDFNPIKERPSDAATVKSLLAAVDRSDEPSAYPVSDYMDWLMLKYKNLSGYDVDELLHKYSLTDEERQALANYRDFAIGMMDEKIKELQDIDKSDGKRQIDMAILAGASYGDRDYLGKTDWIPVSSDFFVEGSPLRNLSESIEKANVTGLLTGFHAELFYNEVTGGYTVGFKGSDNPLDLQNMNDWINNFFQGAGVDFPQRKQLDAIIDAINALPADADINIVGHSLGGALASYVGLTTGKETYTFNAEGISDNILKANGLYEKKENGDYNIKAYYNPDDILSNVQDVTPGNTVIASAIGTRIPLDDMASPTQDVQEQSNQFFVDPESHIADKNAQAIEGAINSFLSHRMGPIIKRNLSKYSDEQGNWEKNRINVSQMNIEAGNLRMRTLGSVSIYNQ